MRVWLALLMCLAGPLWAADCRDLTHKNLSYTVCEVDAAKEELRLFLNDPESGGLLGSFSNVDGILQDQGQTLGMAMNAGMYHRDRSPVGHYLENGTTLKKPIRAAGPGNFGLLPNGVFCIRVGRADVIETLRYDANPPNCRHATQSGPMLVIDGKLHPRFLPDSTSRYVRNGVGTSPDGQRVVFAISNQVVTFHEFGTLFRDVLNLPNALYFDGNISRLYAPDQDRHDGGLPMGPIVGTVVARP